MHHFTLNHRNLSCVLLNSPDKFVQTANVSAAQAGLFETFMYFLITWFLLGWNFELCMKGNFLKFYISLLAVGVESRETLTVYPTFNRSITCCQMD